jgi:hypothetical protein
MSDRRLAIIGALPPPYGGVSVHVSRLRSLLARNDVEYVLYEQNGKADRGDAKVVPLDRSPIGFLRFLATVPERVLHLHFHNPNALVCATSALRMRRGKQYILTLHSENLLHSWETMTRVARRLASSYCRSAHHVVCVNSKIQRFVIDSLGVREDSTSHIPAFLAPSDEESCDSNIPVAFREFLATHQTIVGSHAWFGSFHQGSHIYGLDAIARLVEEVHSTDRSIGVYTVISGCYSDAHRREVLQLRERFAETWFINEQPFSTPAVFRKTDVFLRPTATDGDSVSVRECLFYGATVLASDAVPRPDGCVTYPFGDHKSLSERFWSIAQNPRGRAVADITPPGAEFGNQLVQLLKAAVNG